MEPAIEPRARRSDHAGVGLRDFEHLECLPIDGR